MNEESTIGDCSDCSDCRLPIDYRLSIDVSSFIN